MIEILLFCVVACVVVGDWVNFAIPVEPHGRLHPESLINHTTQTARFTLKIRPFPSTLYFDMKADELPIFGMTSFVKFEAIHNLQTGFPHAYQQSYPQADRQVVFELFNYETQQI